MSRADELSDAAYGPGPALASSLDALRARNLDDQQKMKFDIARDGLVDVGEIDRAFPRGRGERTERALARRGTCSSCVRGIDGDPLTLTSNPRCNEVARTHSVIGTHVKCRTRV